MEVLLGDARPLFRGDFALDLMRHFLWGRQRHLAGPDHGRQARLELELGEGDDLCGQADERHGGVAGGKHVLIQGGDHVVVDRHLPPLLQKREGILVPCAEDDVVGTLHDIAPLQLQRPVLPHEPDRPPAVDVVPRPGGGAAAATPLWPQVGPCRHDDLRGHLRDLLRKVLPRVGRPHDDHLLAVKGRGRPVVVRVHEPPPKVRHAGNLWHEARAVVTVAHRNRVKLLGRAGLLSPLCAAAVLYGPAAPALRLYAGHAAAEGNEVEEGVCLCVGREVVAHHRVGGVSEGRERLVKGKV
mmetsp:Transcript_29735/g.69503  ORF Transcript_29735/g.69503 Transcript_29735/m.69503 type:complete len:298 (-) Transcript_29735:256-1149(-)